MTMTWLKAWKYCGRKAWQRQPDRTYVGLFIMLSLNPREVQFQLIYYNVVFVFPGPGEDLHWGHSTVIRTREASVTTLLALHIFYGTYFSLTLLSFPEHLRAFIKLNRSQGLGMCREYREWKVKRLKQMSAAQNCMLLANVTCLSP